MNLAKPHALSKKEIVFKSIIISLVLLLFLFLFTGCINKPKNSQENHKKTVLTIASLGDDYNLSTYIREFNNAQSDYYVEVKEYTRLDTSEALETLSFRTDDGISILQREIVSGCGPDLIDYGPSFTTADICGEYTEDLRKYFSKDYERINDYFYENVFDAFSYKDKLYCVPTGFFIETLVGKRKNLGKLDSWNLQEMIAFLSENRGKNLWANASQIDVFSRLLTANMEQYIDWENGKSHFDDESFQKLLSFCKELPASPGKKVSQKEFGEDKVLLYTVNTGSEFEITKIKMLFANDDLSFIGYPSDNHEGSKVQTGATVLGISSSSKNKDAAYSFIKFVLSEDIQKKYPDGFSVNRAVMSSLIKDAQIEEFANDSNKKKEPIAKDTVDLYGDEGFNIYSISKEDASETEALLNSNFCSSNIDWSLYFVIRDEAFSYFNNGQTLEKTVENIQNRASLYVAERGM